MVGRTILKSVSIGGGAFGFPHYGEAVEVPIIFSCKLNIEIFKET